MRTILSLIFSIFYLALLGQRPCATQQYQHAIRGSRLQISQDMKQAEVFLQQATQKLTGIEGKTSTGIIRIPVVVHVLYQSSAQNISEQQIKSGIEALNRDFRRRNKDSVNTPARFTSLAADVEIEFALATADPFGRPTTGILRKKTSVKEWSMDDAIKYGNRGGDDAWDSKSYLNIWIGNLPRVLGYSSVLGGPDGVDGIAVHYGAYGTIGVSGAYNMGRTLVHEAGHWLGLKHIWGDDDCGNDEVDDTPQQAGFTSGCPGGFISTCSNGSAGDMYMNYMDFTNDACMNLFTQGQKERMRSCFVKGGPRYRLLASRGLDAPWVEEIPVVQEPTPEVAEPQVKRTANLYPNPATTSLTLELDHQNWLGKEWSIVTLSGVAVKKFTVTSLQQLVEISKLQPGMYFLTGEQGNSRMHMKFVKVGSVQ